MSNKKIIENPLNNSIFKTFINQFIQIHFFESSSEKKKISLENLKNLLFPAETTEETFNNLIEFVENCLETIIKTNVDIDVIQNDLLNEYEFDENTFEILKNCVENQRDEIIDYLNRKFNDNNNKLKKINWSTKMILSGMSSENHYNGKYVDIEFNYCKNENVIKHKNITFLKDDVKKFIKELNKIKENLDKIKNV
jgi:hypothetical protein